MVNKSAINTSLVLTLPLTTATASETIDITNFTTEGDAVRHNFSDTNRANIKIGTDGTGEIFSNPNKIYFIEFTIVPLSDLDAKLINFNLADSTSPVVVQMKDKNTGVNIFSEKAIFKTVNDNVISADPDYKTYRLELVDWIQT